MFTQLLGAVATVYGVLGALKTLLQTRQMLARRSSGDVSAVGPVFQTARGCERRCSRDGCTTLCSVRAYLDFQR